MNNKRFNIRIYFLLFDEAGNILVSDEIIRGEKYTKFPGGGLEWGEGIAACLQREAMEELGQEIEVIDHFYTTDFFIESAFRPDDQVISIYYLARLKSEAIFRTSTKRFDFLQAEKDEESFRWVSAENLDEGDFAFPADRKVVQLLQL
ncbi:MAG: NUDIX hydrolase [Flavobacteriales bacterium]